MPPAARPYPVERSGDLTRQRILVAAADLFSRAGYGATTVRDIARDCDLTDPAIYYYFRSKREILAALLVEPALPKPPSNDDVTRDDVLAYVGDLISFWSEHVAFMRLMYRQSLEDDPDLRDFGLRVAAALRAGLAPMLHKIYGVQAERIFDVVYTLLIGLLLDALLEFGSAYTEGARGAAFGDRARALFSMVLPDANLATAGDQ